MNSLFPKSKNNVSDQELLDWLQLTRCRNVGPITFYKLLEAYGSAGEVLKMLPDLARQGGTKAYQLYDRKFAEKEQDRLRKMGGRFITAQDRLYPKLLREIDDAPPVLAVAGDLDLLSKDMVSIVGARNASINGKKFTQKIAETLGRQGYAVSSGLARGIDTAAHLGSLQSGTVAVLAGGIDVCYPQENQELYEAISRQGVLISESALGTQPKAQHFPRRNRIVSGMARALVVVEATMKSGSLMTARLAGDQGREVMAVPGFPADPRASGPNALIRDGAILVRNAEDITEHLQSFSNDLFGFQESDGGQGFDDFHHQSKPQQVRDQDRAQVIENLSSVPVPLDELLRTCDLKHGVLQTILLELELAGRVQRVPGNCVVAIQE